MRVTFVGALSLSHAPPPLINMYLTFSGQLIQIQDKKNTANKSVHFVCLIQPQVCLCLARPASVLSLSVAPNCCVGEASVKKLTRLRALITRIINRKREALVHRTWSQMMSCRLHSAKQDITSHPSRPELLSADLPLDAGTGSNLTKTIKVCHKLLNIPWIGNRGRRTFSFVCSFCLSMIGTV